LFEAFSGTRHAAPGGGGNPAIDLLAGFVALHGGALYARMDVGKTIFDPADAAVFDGLGISA